MVIRLIVQGMHEVHRRGDREAEGEEEERRGRARVGIVAGRADFGQGVGSENGLHPRPRPHTGWDRHGNMIVYSDKISGSVDAQRYKSCS